MSRRGSLTRVAAVAAVAALGLTACSGSGSGEEGGQSNASSDTGSKAGSAAEQGEAEVTGTVPDLDEPIASRTVKQEGNTYRLDVFPLTVGEGDSTLAVNVRLVFENFADGIPETVLSGSSPFSHATRTNNGFTLIDSAAGTGYSPARDADDEPVCSPTMPTSAVSGDEVYVTCVFAGIPADVETLDLVVASFGTFDDVPVI